MLAVVHSTVFLPLPCSPQFSAEEQHPFSEMFSLPPFVFFLLLLKHFFCSPLCADVRFIFRDLPASREDLLSGGGNVAEQATHYSVGVQTDYRESETQTDPYSPAYVIRDGTTPSELLQLAAFTWGMRSPAAVAVLDAFKCK